MSREPIAKPNVSEIDWLLINVMEEAAEVIQACSKAIRFGLAHTEPGYGHNGHRIAIEFGQLAAAYDALGVNSFGCLPLDQHGVGYAEKLAYIRLWLGK